jgi:CelD/BcsL family acetyltransferase involved in cellulose biosynthesis
VRDVAGFEALAPEWDALVSRCDDQVFYSHSFLRCWLTHFAPRAALRVLTGRAPHGRLVAALALMEVKSRQYGLPVRQLVSLGNKHSGRFDMLAEWPPQAGAALASHLARDPSWDVLRLCDVPEHGSARALLHSLSQAGLPVGIWPSARSPYVLLPPSLEAWQARRRRELKALRRRRRRLEERGLVTLERVSHPHGLDALLSECLSLELRGWKGRGGTAIAQDRRTLGFYSELAHTAARTGHLALYLLRLDGRLLAFQLGLSHSGRYLALKPGYDEAFHEFSPGQLLTEGLLQDCIARGLSECDLLGDDTPSKRVWTDSARPHGWLYVFRDTLAGRALWSAKFRWAPAARRVVRRWARRR